MLLPLIVLGGCSKPAATSPTTLQTPSTQSESSTASTSQKIANEAQKETEIIDLSGTYYSISSDTAIIKLLQGNKWEISYSTLDGDVSATFEPKWETLDKIKKSNTPMQKSDEYSEFNMLIEYTDESDIEITMEDGNPTHTMIFSKQKPKENEQYEVVLQGDLSPFAGQLSTNEFNKTIADSRFTLGGYSPDDYYNNRTTVFPAITENGYWNGMTSHGNFEVIASDLPKKVDGYFEVRVHGTNSGANNAVLTFFLVPPNVSGLDGTTSNDKRVFQALANGETQLMEYQKEKWWTEYQSQ
ncbi:hypothetical protein [Enterococcus rivorum]|uniref:Uncharacterized protein n=1 Tax=Enterococcus rivorum TaxID=762845 RepID=A0A1E5KUX7_9ENTE|nr:hypothetical protein [Enterococcus rivorum]MBP2100394.1 hypothetical protein [Enterococcus rivorum]OEH81696.1 hypothetical protein BCR26_15670 [Enterococcus rivorum]